MCAAHVAQNCLLPTILLQEGHLVHRDQGVGKPHPGQAQKEHPSIPVNLPHCEQILVKVEV